MILMTKKFRNSLAKLASKELLSEWNIEKNGDLTPDDIGAYSQKKVWWICKNKHEWEATIGNRFLGSSKCPYCANRKIGYGNDLASQHPELMKEIDTDKNEVDPSSITYGSKTKLWWKCSSGHSWKATAQTRLRNRGCPYCANKKLGQGNDLDSMYPKLALDWNEKKNGFPTSHQIAGGSFQAWWVCKDCGHEWQRDVKGRVDGAGCPMCSIGKAQTTNIENRINKEGSLEDNLPELLPEWHSKKNKLPPSRYLSGSDKKVWWLCPKGHSYKMAIKLRAKKDGYGCPKCSGNTSKIEIRTLVELSLVFGKLDWRKKFEGNEADISSNKYKFILEVDGYPWHKDTAKRDIKKQNIFLKQGYAVYRLRDIKLASISGNEIPFDSSKFTESGFLKSLQKLIKLIINNQEGIPERIQKSAQKYLTTTTFKANDDYLDYLKYYRGPAPGMSLQDKFPEISAEWSSSNILSPDQVSPDSRDKYLFICPKRHEYSQTIGSRTRMKTNCPICANRQVLAGYNDVESLYPQLVKEWSPNNLLKPSEVVYRTKKKALWICLTCGKEYESAVRNRTQKGTGCRSCSLKQVYKLKKQT